MDGPGKGLRKAASTAALLYFLEVFCLQQGLITVIVAIGAFVVLPLKALAAFLRGEKAVSKLRMMKASIYALMVAASFASIALNNQLARGKAERIIAACRRYQSQHGRLPEKLEDVAPEFLPRIPLAKVALMFNEFEYLSHGGRTSLMWTAMPPFGRPYYVFEEDRWGALD